MTYALYDHLVNAMLLPDEAARKRVIRRLLLRLPNSNRATLRALLSFLNKVAQHSAQNKMAAHNLSTVFAPNLVKSAEGEMLSIVAHSPQVNALVAMLSMSSYPLFASYLAWQAILSFPLPFRLFFSRTTRLLPLR